MTIRIAPLAHGVPADLGRPEIPLSKSHAQRAMCLAELLPIAVELRRLPDSTDVATLARALPRVAAALASDRAAGWQGDPIALADNGTALRILSVLVPLLGGEVAIDAGPRLRERPMAAATEFLTRNGAKVSTGWPMRFDGRGVEWPTELVVDASVTTQVATGVLLGAAIRTTLAGSPHPGTGAPPVIRITTPAAPDYLFLTIETLTWFGFEVPASWQGDDLMVEIQAWQPPTEPHRVEIPIDPSSYTFFAAFLAMHGFELAPPGTSDPHPDWLAVDDIQRLLGAEPHAELEFTEIGSRPDTFPCLAALAALRSGRTTIRGAPALRHKESDRIRAMARALGTLGVRCEELPDGLTIHGPMPAHDRPVAVPTPDDHRVVMAIALLGTRIPGGVELRNPEAVAKSWPGYFEWLGRVGVVTWSGSDTPG